MIVMKKIIITNETELSDIKSLELASYSIKSSSSVVHNYGGSLHGIRVDTEFNQRRKTIKCRISKEEVD